MSQFSHGNARQEIDNSLGKCSELLEKKFHETYTTFVEKAATSIFLHFIQNFQGTMTALISNSEYFAGFKKFEKLKKTSTEWYSPSIYEKSSNGIYFSIIGFKYFTGFWDLSKYM